MRKDGIQSRSSTTQAPSTYVPAVSRLWADGGQAYERAIKKVLTPTKGRSVHKVHTRSTNVSMLQ